MIKGHINFSLSDVFDHQTPQISWDLDLNIELVLSIKNLFLRISPLLCLASGCNLDKLQAL